MVAMELTLSSRALWVKPSESLWFFWALYEKSMDREQRSENCPEKASFSQESDAF